MIHTAAQALADWDAGKKVPSIRLEYENAEQSFLQACVFELLKGWLEYPDPKEFTDLERLAASKFGDKLTERERHSVISMVWVTTRNGWQRTIDLHDSKELIEVSKGQ